MSFPLSRAHRSRLMQVWRSAGWPCRDTLELDLIAAGLLVQRHEADGRDAVQLSEAGIAVLTEARAAQRRSASPHDLLARRFAQRLVAEGRVVWRELALRAPVVQQGLAPMPAVEPLWPDDTPAPTAGGAHRWRVARVDLFSVRNTTVEAYLQPAVHEVKVSRADLLSDLRHGAKREAYEALCSACHYVLPAGLADPDEIPPQYGLWLLQGRVDDPAAVFEQVRPARAVHCTLPFAVWMALAKATPVPADDEPLQPMLGAAA